MPADKEDYALFFRTLKNGKIKIEKVYGKVDRTHRPMSPEHRKQIEAWYKQRERKGRKPKK